MNIIERPSPNFDSRDGHAVDMLVLHYTGMKTAQEALTRLCGYPEKVSMHYTGVTTSSHYVPHKVSAHYVVDEDGTVYNLVAEENRAWHAGVSFWRGAANINQRSIGIEIVNPGHEFGYHPFPVIQMKKVAWLCKEVLSRHPIPPRNVVGHSDIAPERKQDPGELFDWQTLARLNIGLWPIAPNNHQPATNEQLAKYGYDMTNPAKTITAFQRHFRPKLLNGQWDKECGELLAALLSMV